MHLTIHHNIYLTREQRYALHEGKDVEVVGVSLPIWCKGNWTNEPGKEVFCKYVLKNLLKNIPVKILEEGYEIVLPYKTIKKIEVTNEEYWQMSEEERYPGVQACSENLLDIKDGGSECLMYRESDKNILHFITIQDIAKLEHHEGSLLV